MAFTTYSQSTLTVTIPSGKLKFSFPNSQKEEGITITIPPRSQFTTGLHWHETHTEYIRILKGRAYVTVGDNSKICDPGDGDIKVPKSTLHEYMRADAKLPADQGDDGDVEIFEWTEPADGLKEVFFRNGVSAFLVRREKVSLGLVLQVVLIMSAMDNYPLLLPRWAGGWYLIHGLFYALAPLARILGMKSWYEEFTPRHLWPVAERETGLVGKGMKKGA